MGLNKVECIIKPFKLEEVKNALTALGVSGMTVYEVRGFGRQRGHKEIYRGAEYTVDFVPKLKIELFIDGDLVDRVVETLCTAAKTGTIGDGKVAVTTLDSLTRIRTGEKGVDAL